MKCVLVAIVLFTSLANLFAQTSAPVSSVAEVYIIGYMDLDPTRAADGATLLVEETLTVKRAAGCVEVHLVKEQGRPNDLILIEIWQSAVEWNAFRSGAQYKHFRDQLQPMLASPYDQRIGKQIAS